MNEIRFIDLFSGIGGFRLGLEEANRSLVHSSSDLERQETVRLHESPKTKKGGDSSAMRGRIVFRCVWSCDNNKYANQVYTARFGEANHYPGDIRGVDPRNIPDFDLLCAGFPCQAFSVAGKRKGFQDTRGTLFFEICRVAEAKRPSLLLLENVKGLLNHDGGRTFTVILQSLEELGYWIEWQVLNSKYFGVPQNRQRVFIVGHSRNGSPRPIFPITENGGLPEPPRSETLPTLTGTDYKGPSKQRATALVLDTFNRGSKKEEAYSLKTNPSHTSSAVLALLTDNPSGSSTKVAISFTNPHNAEEERKVNLSDTSRAVKPPYGNQQPLIFHENISRNVSILEEAVALRSEASHSYQGVIENFRIRRLTPVECERLQGFPDGWTEGLSDTQRYKCLGNAVTVNVIEFLGRQIIDLLRDGKE